jgi:hypothetical protein
MGFSPCCSCPAVPTVLVTEKNPTAKYANHAKASQAGGEIAFTASWIALYD